MQLTVREVKKEELTLVVDYFINADVDYLMGMGADKDKLPSQDKWLEKLTLEFDKPIEQKEYYYLLWLEEDMPVGHSNINQIDFGNTAKLHLHLWQSHNRKKGMGEVFIKKSIPFYFKNFDLQSLICEPYAKNPAPNKILPKLGFEFVKKHKTIPGMINFHQQVNKYVLSRSKYLDKAQVVLAN